jgi:hypothetical protein
VTENVGLPNAEGLLEPFGHGVGYQDFFTLTSPAAGTNLSFIVESRNWIRLLAAMATITTDANVANRFVSLDFITPRGTTYMRNAGGFVETATNNGVVYAWTEQRTDSAKVAGGSALLPLSSIFLPPGTTVRFTLDAIQATDAITAASLTVERFDTGAIGYTAGFVTPDEG